MTAPLVFHEGAIVYHAIAVACNLHMHVRTKQQYVLPHYLKSLQALSIYYPNVVNCNGTINWSKPPANCLHFYTLFLLSVIFASISVTPYFISIFHSCGMQICLLFQNNSCILHSTTLQISQKIIYNLNNYLLLNKKIDISNITPFLNSSGYRLIWVKLTYPR